MNELETRPYIVTVIVIESVVLLACAVPAYWLGPRYLLGIVAGWLVAAASAWRSSRIQALRRPPAVSPGHPQERKPA